MMNVPPLTTHQATSAHYPAILALWERSVRATHDFLQPEDIAFYRDIIPAALDQVKVQLWYLDDALVGFSGTDGDELVMLFLDPAYFGRGFGHFILADLIQNQGITKIEVNTQNKHAKQFYERHGFKVVAEAPLDGFGRPYPITTLRR